MKKSRRQPSSCAKVLNIGQSDDCGAHIITVTQDIMKKSIKFWSSDLDAVPLDTVNIFHQDARIAGCTI